MVGAFGAEDALLRAVGAPGLDAITLWQAVGCGECNHTGYKGRVAIHELLIANDALRSAVQAQAGVGELRRIAQENGMSTLLQDGIFKAVNGQTELKRVLSVCSR